MPAHPSTLPPAPAWLQSPASPWYREPWPWLLMSGPAAVIVAGVITTTMAFRTADGLVAGDYYKQGLMINRTLARDDAARRHHLGAQAALPIAAGGQVRLTLTGDIAPRTMLLRLTHPTRAGMDRSITLTQVQQGVYEGTLDPPSSQSETVRHWLVTLEQGDWRLTGEWQPPAMLRLTSVAP